MNKNLLFVLTALEAISKTKLYSNPFSNAQDLFEFGEQLHFNAILKMLEVIGEEANKIDE